MARFEGGKDEVEKEKVEVPDEDKGIVEGLLYLLDNSHGGDFSDMNREGRGFKEKRCPACLVRGHIPSSHLCHAPFAMRKRPRVGKYHSICAFAWRVCGSPDSASHHHQLYSSDSFHWLSPLCKLHKCEYLASNIKPKRSSENSPPMVRACKVSSSP